MCCVNWLYHNNASTNRPTNRWRLLDDYVLKIPDTIEGKPVTVLGITNDSSYPVGASIDAYGVVETCRVILPKYLEEIRGGITGSSVAWYEIDESNAYYATKQGVVYSKDLSTLVAFPRHYLKIEDGEDISTGKGIHYRVPEGTESIGVSAFSYSDVVTITLPNSLETIDEQAFAHMPNLKKVIFGDSLESIGRRAFLDDKALRACALPDSVEHIGAHAFEGIGSYESISLPENLVWLGEEAFAGIRDSGESDNGYGIVPGAMESDVLTIGPYLAHVGHDALSGLAYETCEVDEENETYSGTGPLLLYEGHRGGAVLVACSSAASGAITIPDDVIRIDNVTFPQTVTDVFIPETTIAFSVPLWDNQRDLGDYPISLHVVRGSEADRFAQANDLPFVY